VPPDPEPCRPREGAAPPDPLPGRFLQASLLPIQSDAHPFEGEGKGAERKGRPWVMMAWGAREAKLRQRTKAEPAACLPAAGLHRERERERSWERREKKVTGKKTDCR